MPDPAQLTADPIHTLRPSRAPTEIHATPSAFHDIDHALAHPLTNPLTLQLDYELGAIAEPTAIPDIDPTQTIARIHHTDPTHSHADPLATPLTFRSSLGRPRYTDAVAHAVELIHAGDIFQTNLAHALIARTTEPFERVIASIQQAFTTLRPRHGHLALHTSEGSAHATASFSPELFLHVEPARPGQQPNDLSGRRVVTRPIKGTRRAGDRHALEHSAKDNAELAMIVDLMRNDLGRVCTFGSIRVEERRAFEQHHHDTNTPGVEHTVATIAGTCRDGTTLGSLLAATFPPGSVTGAPKVRAMQIIDQLEREPGFPARGPYCGSIGTFQPNGEITLNVAIRTLTVRQTEDAVELILPVGAGIVSESDPQAEWEETLDKARPIVHALGGTIEHDHPTQ